MDNHKETVLFGVRRMQASLKIAEVAIEADDHGLAAVALADATNIAPVTEMAHIARVRNILTDKQLDQVSPYATLQRYNQALVELGVELQQCDDPRHAHNFENN